MHWRSVIALLGVSLLLSCDNPSSPTPPTTPPPPPPPPPPVTAAMTGLRIDGPNAVAPGETAKFTATAQFNNGTTEDYSSRASWSSTDTGVLRIEADGRATGVVNGDVGVRAVVERFSTNRNIIVTPSGTWKLVGQVTEGTVPVPSVRIAVLEGVGSGLRTFTDDFGGFKLYGVIGDVRLEIYKEGFAKIDKVVTVPPLGQVSFALTALGPRLDISGTYEMAIEANAACTAFPTDARTRRYIASIAQDGAGFRVQLSGASFEVRDGLGSGFAGNVQPGAASAYLSDGYYAPWPDLVEKIANGRFFGAAGRLTLAAHGNDLAGTLRGSLYLMSSPGGYFFYAPLIARCPTSGPGFPDDHRVTLRRLSSASPTR